MKLRLDPPADNHTISLAPRVYGLGDYVGEYGFALELTSTKVRVLWDAGGVEDVDPNSIVFFSDGGKSERR